MKFSPQIHLFAILSMLANLAAPALVWADPPHTNSVCARINTPKAKIDEKEREKNRRNLFGSWNKTLIKDLSRQHRSLKFISKTGSARAAQESYLKFLTQNVAEFCELQLGTELGVSEFAARLNKSSGKEMCDRFEEVETLYAKTNNALAIVKKGLEQRLKNLRAELSNRALSNRTNLDELDRTGTNTKERVPLVTFPHSGAQQTSANAVTVVGSSPHLSLREEQGIIWGSNFVYDDSNSKSDKLDPNAFYPGIYLRLENEKKELDRVSRELTRQQIKMESTKNDCALIGGGRFSTKADTVSAESDVTGTEETNPSVTEENLNSPSEIARENREAERLAAEAEKAALNNPEPTQVLPEETPGGELPDDREKPVPYIAPNDDDKDQPVYNGPIGPPVKEEGFLSRNKGLLLTVGAGAAAVGGILWYKKKQDKKAEDDLAMLDAEAAARASLETSNSDSSTSGSTSSNFGGAPANISTPQGSKFVISGIPSGAEVGNNLTEITVAIIDPQGIQTQDSMTDITVACAVPAGCSLTGTLTVNTNAGKAVFNDLRFTAPHDGVKLIFSAPGFESVTSGNPFNVTGSAAPRE